VADCTGFSVLGCEWQCGWWCICWDVTPCSLPLGSMFFLCVNKFLPDYAVNSEDSVGHGAVRMDSRFWSLVLFPVAQSYFYWLQEQEINNAQKGNTEL
jgi:hypothetical protein